MQVRGITRHNVCAALPELKRALKRCTFVTFDTEMGGLGLLNARQSMMDSVEERYDHHRANAQHFPIVQFGFCCFTWDPSARVFEVECFQAPVFPRYYGWKGRPEAPDRRFLMQAKCLQYIREHGFDLNDWVDNGVGYLSHHEQQSLRSILDPEPTDVTANATTDQLIDQHTQRFLDELTAKLKGLDKKQAKRRASLSKDAPTPTSTLDLEGYLSAPFEQASAEVKAAVACHLTEPLGTFRRIALAQHLREKLPRVAILCCEADNEDCDPTQPAGRRRRLRLIVAQSEEERQQLIEAHARQASEKATERKLAWVGFTSVLDLIIESRTPIVGHNAVLDWMQCFETFHQPLPPKCGTFLGQLHQWLTGDVSMDAAKQPERRPSCIFDTKALLQHALDAVDLFANKLEHTALEHAYTTLSKAPFHGPDIRWKVTNATNANEAHTMVVIEGTQHGAHQAGYDAFMTGCVFLRVCCGLGVGNDAIAALPTAAQPLPPVLKRFQNQLHLSNFLPLHCLAVQPRNSGCNGDDDDDDTEPTPDRRCLVRLELVRTPPMLSTFHIQQQVSWVLSLRSSKHVHVHWDSRTRVFLALPSPEHVAQLIAARADTAEQHGTPRKPMPSIGCVDVFACDDTHIEESATLLSLDTADTSLGSSDMPKPSPSRKRAIGDSNGAHSDGNEAKKVMTEEDQNEI